MLFVLLSSQPFLLLLVGRDGDKLSGLFGLPGGFLVVLDFPRVTLDNVAVRVMMRRPTDQEKFEGWLSGQTCDLRGEIGFGSCLLALAEGGDKLACLASHAVYSLLTCSESNSGPTCPPDDTLYCSR
ncbi:hypothetical protein NQZ68_011485 [Dissostichus eleginoides]|nr:hypothetical protein NQZ68_011485 [Dissostichus eleginoides]